MASKTALHFVIEGSFCSFRDPVAAKYQPTFWYPPKTTVIGFLGCALGLAPPELEPLYDQIGVGVVLERYGGLARDLWGFTKLKGAVKPETAVLIRELIYQPRYALYVTAEDRLLQRLQLSVADPIYPLRLGRGEDLAMLANQPTLTQVSTVEETPWLYWTLLPFALHKGALMLGETHSNLHPRRPPRSVKMPIRFRYKANWEREADFAWMTQVFDWGVRPATANGVWTDGRHHFYLV